MVVVVVVAVDDEDVEAWMQDLRLAAPVPVHSAKQSF